VTHHPSPVVLRNGPQLTSVYIWLHRSFLCHQCQQRKSTKSAGAFADVPCVVCCRLIDPIHGAATAQNTTINLDNTRILGPFTGGVGSYGPGDEQREGYIQAEGRDVATDKMDTEAGNWSCVELGVLIYTELGQGGGGLAHWLTHSCAYLSAHRTAKSVWYGVANNVKDGHTKYL
jgi:hypothetical protein